MQRRPYLSLLLVVPSLLPGCSNDANSAPTPVAVTEVADAQYTSIEQIEASAIKKDVPYVPTQQKTVDEMLRLAKVDRNDVVYDLGSGDGRIVITAAKQYGARGVGYDIDPVRIAEANENAKTAGVTDKVKFIQGDLFQADLSDATAVTLYLLRSVNLRLRPKLLDELKPGTPVVSHDFDMGEWEPEQHVRLEDDDVYLWIIPAKADGRWSWKAGSATRTANLTQEFQKLSGTVGDAQIQNGKLDGERISFEVANGGAVEKYSGRVAGRYIEGTVQTGNRRSQWRATHE